MFRTFMAKYIIDVCSAAVLWLPVLAVLDIIFCRRMVRIKKAGCLLFVVYLSAVCSIVGFPGITSLTVDITYNLIPFADIASGFERYIELSLLNILLFLPLGILLPFLWKEFRSLKNIILFGAGLSFVIEVLQLFTFRASDVDDLIMNTGGTVIGYGLITLCTGRFRYDPAEAESGCAKRELSVLMGIVLLSEFFVQPFVSDKLWEWTQSFF